MPTDIDPRKVQESVQRGFDRLANFRAARLMFLRQYVGQYFDQERGAIGDEPLNLIFNAIRILVPNIVMNFPKHTVASRFLASRDYAELLSLALNYQGKDLNLKDVYRKAIVDAIFTVGILKTGLAESDSVYSFDEYDRIDTGTVYTENVSFDSLVVDPNSVDHRFRDARYIGDKICVPRRMLLDSGLYRNDLIEQLPMAGQELKNETARSLSMRNIAVQSNYDLDDEVEIVELWVPEAQTVLTVPGAKDVLFDEYLRVDDYYGPDTGPYTFLFLTPPVPDNPMSVPMVGIWHDLHVLANRLAKKTIDQAERQKDILLYRRAAADDAIEARDAADGEAVATDDPTGINQVSLGGQRQSNEMMTGQLHNWFNMMASNPQGIGGQQLDADSATEAKILQNNANIGLEDMKDLVYQMGATEAGKRAWYLHTDPLIEVPLVRRRITQPQYTATPAGPVLTQPAEMQEEQVFLTPEARRGDWLDFTFDIQPESMGRVDSSTRLQQALQFAVKIMPAAAQVAQTMFMLQIPFDVKAFIIRMAKDAGIDWMDEVFFDPEFQMKMMQKMMSGPDPAQSKGRVNESGEAQNGPDLMAAILQNGQPGNVMGGMPGASAQANADAQQGAADAQSNMRTSGMTPY